MKSKILTFEILQLMHRKFPAEQWNRQNVILFHETIPFLNHGMKKLNWGVRSVLYYRSLKEDHY
jgi:hypothetical protein